MVMPTLYLDNGTHEGLVWEPECPCLPPHRTTHQQPTTRWGSRISYPSCLSISSPPPKLEGHWSHSGVRHAVHDGPGKPNIGVYAQEGHMPIGEACGCPANSPDTQTQGSTVWEPEPDNLKACVRAHQAWRPVLDDGGHTCLDLWLNLGVVIIDPDIYFGSASQLEGE